MVATMLSETESPAPGSLKELRWGREERRVDGGVRNENKLVIRVEGCPPTDCPCLGRCVCLAGAEQRSIDEDTCKCANHGGKVVT